MAYVNRLRISFPILRSKVNGKQLVYLDNAATTQKPHSVVKKMVDCYFRTNANIHRGVHYLSRKATEIHEDARSVAQGFLNAASSAEIIFTHGTTDAVNLLASSYGKAFMQTGDEVIVSAMEHHSNIVPWQLQGFKLKVIPLNSRGELQMDALPALFTEKTRLVAVTHISNVLGTVNPVEDIVRIAHERDVPVFIDGAQAVAHRPVDVQALDVDFYAFSGHKVYGPTGTGILYGKQKWLDAMPPYQGGGEMIKNVSFEKTTFNELPYKFEAGTPDFIGSAGLATALQYVQNMGWKVIQTNETELMRYAELCLRGVEGVRIIGEPAERSGVISFLLDKVHHYDVGMILDQLGIAVRTGHHCAEPLMNALGIDGTVRISFAIYNTWDDVSLLVQGLEKVKSMF